MENTQEQGAETPVTVPAQGASTPVTAQPSPQHAETTPPPFSVPQSDWQRTQERLKEMEMKAARDRKEQFEQRNPIVLSDKHKGKWADLIKQHETPGHRYERLDYEELLRIMHDPDDQEARPIQQPVTVPSFNPSAAPELPQGSISQEARGWLSMRYSDEEIKATERQAQ